MSEQDNSFSGLVKFAKWISKFRAAMQTIMAAGVLFICGAAVSAYGDFRNVKLLVPKVEVIETRVSNQDRIININTNAIELTKAAQLNINRDVTDMKGDIKDIRNLLYEIARGQRTLINK